MSPPPTAVTRYLCAGAYLDDDFARAVLDEVVADPHRGVAPAPGVDVETVARHCLAAVRRSVRRDVVICVILLAIAVTAGLRGLLVVTWLCSTILVLRSIRKLTLADVSAAVVHLLAFLVISVACAGGLVLIATRRDDATGDGPLAVLSSLSLPALVGIGVLALWITTYLDAVARYSVLTEGLAPSRFAPDPEFPVVRPADQERFRYLGQAQTSSLSIYAADAVGGPFVGLGDLVHAWTAGAQIGSADMDPAVAASAVSAPMIYERLREAGRPLEEAEAVDASRPEVVVGELVTAPGWIPIDHPFVDPSRHRPMSSIPSPVVDDLRNKPAGTETYYTTIELTVRAGDSTVTGLVHVDVIGTRLDLEVALTALPAVKPSFRSVDAPAPTMGLALTRLLGSSVVDLVRVVPKAPLQVLRSIRRATTGRMRGLGRDVIDIGARVGVRELAGGDHPRNAAADFEVTRSANLISRTVVDAVLESLSSQGVDAQEFLDGADKVWRLPMAATPRAPASGGLVP